MKFTTVIATISLVTFMYCGNVFAQDEDDDEVSEIDFHPYLTDKFTIQLGMFRPEKDFKLRVDGQLPGEEIDFEQEVGASETQTTGSLNFRWRFGEKWSFWGQYWSVDSGGSWRLDEDLEFGDVIFEEGTSAAAGMDVLVARVFFGREFWTKPGHEFGAGFGFHWLEIDAFVEGQVLSNQGDLEFRREGVDAAFPLPNIGGWYAWSFSPRWLLQARVDWLSASIGDYSGGMLNGQFGLNFQVSRHFGLGLAYNAFELDVEVDKDDWKGAVDTLQHGPFLSFEFNW